LDEIIVIGGGPAGLMAAVRAAEQGGSVTLLEKMPIVGKKMLITGKGRCNITNSCDLPDIISNIPGNGQFLYSALRRFTNKDICDFLARWGVPTKVERGGRVFPVSDKAQDVVQAFLSALKHYGGKIYTGQAVREILTAEAEYL
jgi:predicted Rossmann fold flavoprotein